MKRTLSRTTLITRVLRTLQSIAIWHSHYPTWHCEFVGTSLFASSTSAYRPNKTGNDVGPWCREGLVTKRERISSMLGLIAFCCPHVVSTWGCGGVIRSAGAPGTYSLSARQWSGWIVIMADGRNMICRGIIPMEITSGNSYLLSDLAFPKPVLNLEVLLSHKRTYINEVYSITTRFSHLGKQNTTF